MKIAIGSVLALLALGWWLWPRAAAVLLTRDEIVACAVEAAIADGMKGGMSREDAIQSIIVDDGARPDYVAIAKGYRDHFGAALPRTVFEAYVDEGTKICLAKKLKGEKIEFPVLKVRDGYHVLRTPGGSAALVKDGEQSWNGGCMQGYHVGPAYLPSPSPTMCVKD